jgi:DNA-binding NarL/FixJ family response regulator
MSRDVSYSGTRVAVVLESTVTRFGIEGMLRKIPNVREIASFTSLNEVPTRNSYDVMAILASDLADGLQQVAKMRGNGTTLLALVDSSDDNDIARAASVCADGYIDHKDLSVETLAEIIDQARGGKVPLSKAIARRLLARATPQESPRKQLAALTPREREVLQLLVEGLSNKQIARGLRISEHGVKRLVGNVLAKLNCPNRTSAVVLAIQERLCEVPGSGISYVSAR